VKPKAEQAGSDISVEDNGQKPGKGKNAKPVEPPMDYVHVRARRGQATDSQEGTFLFILTVRCLPAC
jgi:hypothetical protein